MTFKKRGIRRISAGSRINNIRINVCEECGAWHDVKPFMCGNNNCVCTQFINFDSKAEAKRWAELLLLKRAGRIDNVTRQKRFPLLAPGPENVPVKVGEYWSDFNYTRLEDGREVVEDVKGVITDLSEWKIRHIKAQYGFDVVLIKH